MTAYLVALVILAMSLKAKSSWRSIPITINTSGQNDLISFEELTDYEVVKTDDNEVLPHCEVERGNITKHKGEKRKRKIKRMQELKAKKLRLLDDNQDTVATADEKLKKNHGNQPSDTKLKELKVSKKRKAKLVSASKPKQEIGGGSMQEQSGFSDEMDMSAWDLLLVPEEIKRALAEMKFFTPTKIQNEVIKPAIQSKLDIVAAAETGSGKTLAFGIPLLHHMMEDKLRGRDETVMNAELSPDEDESLIDDPNFIVETSEEQLSSEKTLLSLVLAPTRELAIQVKEHLSKAGKYCGFKIIAIVGGMSIQKQQRLLDSKPDIIIATPGRLYEFFQQGHEYLQRLHLLRYLVIDEADRMLEKGHFEELVKILDEKKRQTFMFSATLTTIHDAPSRLKAKSKAGTKIMKLETLMSKIGIKEKRLVVDLSTKNGTASSLYEAKIICGTDEKDLFMYYFIRSHPGRTLIFTNSIDCIFHITGVLQALSLTPLHLHAKMQQRQRLKHLERFRDNPNSVLIASDVAARGLDIPNVQHVIHYQVPRTCETYIHRSGRSARTGKEGLSLLLVSPEELPYYKRLCKSMKLEEGIPPFPYDSSSLATLKKIVKLAKEIDSLGHSRKKVRLNNDWFSKAAKEMDIELDDDMLMHDEDADEKEAILKQKRKQLEILLKRPILPKQFSGKYLTKSGKLNLPKMVQKNAIEEVKKVTKSRRCQV